MKELTIKIDDWLNKELEEYLKTLEGVLKVNIADDIYLKYDENLITIKRLKLEIISFLKIKNPIMIGFDKHSSRALETYELIIKDLCCEYCLKENITELLTIDGILQVSTNFDNHNKQNVVINIKYDEKIITREEIKKLEDKFNL